HYRHAMPTEPSLPLSLHDALPIYDIDLMPMESEAKRRARVAQMGLSTTRMDTKAKNLSGGERARLLMGLITFNGPGMLVLDEPTNHLDIDSRDALVHALNDYKGRSEEHTSELQSRENLVCRLLLEKKN